MAFTPGFPTRLSHEASLQGSHVSPLFESSLGVKVEAVQGKQVLLKWTEIFGGLLEWRHDAGVPLSFAVESASS